MLTPPATTNSARAVSDDEFAALMGGLGPFEQAPIIAVAVSGGADSLALSVLASHWARKQGGHAVGLTVDHRLRPAAAEEAAQTGRWLTAYGISHHILTWEDAKPQSGLQAAARTARYALLQDWCARRGVLHLLLAHHRDDQAETLLQRLGRGSGVDGLSAMSAISHQSKLRLLRPLLPLPSARLKATLRDLKQDWIEDPSNLNETFGRVRLRKLMPSLEAEGLTAERLAITAHRMGRARQALEQATADLLARAIALHPDGTATLTLSAWRAAPDDIALRGLERVCRCIGGGDYPARMDRLERLQDELQRGLTTRRSFGGCLLIPWRKNILVCREPARIPTPMPVTAPTTLRWDHRFILRLSGQGTALLDALGPEKWCLLLQLGGFPTDRPAPARHGLPALFDPSGLIAVPHLGFHRPQTGRLKVESITFSPITPLFGATYCLV